MAVNVLLLGHTQADEAIFRSVDGKRSFSGHPVAVISSEKEIVKIQKQDGTTVDVVLTSLAEQDRPELKRWITHETSDPQVKLIARLTASANPAVLFIGNSYSFHVPEAFAKIAREEGRKITVEQVTLGGWPLMKHAQSPKTLAAIKKRAWDAVVLQEQSQIPAFPPAQRDGLMLEPLKSLIEKIEAAGALPVLYQTWARRDGDLENVAVFPGDTFTAMHTRMDECFASLRKANPSLTGVPVGAAWAERMKAGYGAELYNPTDGSHPSAAGNYLAAAVFFSALFDAKVSKAPADIPGAVELNDLATRIARHKSAPYPLPANYSRVP